ncbi:nucleoprotein [Mojui dos Campos virus]|uniref:Nucleoprotein n=1 Tax=Mojui dos Campos virus TaxID=1543245 RepID=A0A088MG55_9VIRU|nr:nucleoprotein [Mojui dos Campos virus]
MAELVFYDTASTGQSGYDPDRHYLAFKAGIGAGVGVMQARIFFLNAKKAKDQLSRKFDQKVNIKFGTWAVEVVNNHFPGNRDSTVGDMDLTLHRISGFLARHILETFLSADPAQQGVIKTQIINPIAESNGITWAAGAEVYLSFFPGTEMFLSTFSFYPLAIGIYRVKKGLMDAQFLKKALRQRYGGMTADQWMQSKTVEVMAAVNVLEKLKWGKSGLGEAARTFLSKFGIVM